MYCKPNRRVFLRVTASACAASTLALTNASASQAKVPRVDAHLHCFAGKDDTRFPYSERAPYRPDAPATPERLLASMNQAGVDYAIVVHPEPYQDDHHYLEHCLN